MLLAVLFACTADPLGKDPASTSFDYGVPVAADSPWPRFRRDPSQDGRGAYPGAESTGAEPWVFPTGKGIFSSPVIDGEGVVYIGSADRAFYAIGPDGEQRWSFATDEIIDSSALLDDDGRVVFGSGDGHVYALDAATGEEDWRFQAADPADNNAFIRWFEGNVAMTAGGDLVAPNDNFHVYALDRQTGQQRWAFRMQDQTWSSPALDVATDTLFLGNNNLLPVGANTYAIDGATGEEVWSRLDAKGSVAASPLWADGGVVVGAFDGFVRRHDPDSGSVVWEVPVRDHVYASAAATSDGAVIVAGADGTVRSLDLGTGAERWAFDTPDPIRSSPVVASDDTVFFGGGDGRLYALDGDDGALRWSITLVEGDRNDLNGSPALGRDGVVIAGESGDVFFVPYEWCATSSDARCETGGERLPEAGTFLWRTSRWGASGAEDGRVGPADPVALSLLHRVGGDTALTLLDAVVVTTDPPVDVTTAVSADRRFLVVSPPATGWGADAVQLHVTGDTVTDPERLGLRFGDGARGPALDVTIDLDVHRGDAPALRVGDTWELWRIAAPLPTILPSYNQIGFDSLHYRVTVVAIDGDQGLGWVEGALPGAEVDVATRTTFPVVLTVADGGVHLDADGGMTLEAMGATLSFSDFRISAALDDGRDAPDGATLAVSAVCGDIPLYGSFLRTLGFCHPDSDELHVFGGALLDARGTTPAPDVGDVTVTYDGAELRADGAGVDPAAHHFALLVVDAAGAPIPLDYGVDTEGASGSVTLDAPGLPAGAHVFVLADGAVVAQTAL